jgi:hypothetical protein
MERTQIFDLMGELKLFGMRSAYDDVMAAGIKRQHEPPLAKDIDDFDFDGTTVNETLCAIF